MDILEERIARMLDEWEISRLLNSYSRALDRHDVDLIQAFFAPDASDHHGEFHGNREQFAQWVNDVHARGTITHSHLLGSPTIRVVGDHARSEIYVYATLISKSDDVANVIGGRYLDRLARRSGEWEVMSRSVVIDWTFEAQRTDRRNTAERFPQGSWGISDPSYAHFAELD